MSVEVDYDTRARMRRLTEQRNQLAREAKALLEAYRGKRKQYADLQTEMEAAYEEQYKQFREQTANDDKLEAFPVLSRNETGRF